MQKLMAIGIVLAALTNVAVGAEKRADFEGTLAQVFGAALRTAHKNWTVTSANQEAAVLSFSTGISMTSNGMSCSALFTERKNGTVHVSLKTQKKGQLFGWGVGDRIAAKFFDGIEEELKAEKAGSLPRK